MNEVILNSNSQWWPNKCYGHWVGRAPCTLHLGSAHLGWVVGTHLQPCCGLGCICSPERV